MKRNVQGKPLYSLAESYRIFYLAMRTIPYMTRGEKNGTLSPVLRERLMIAVTEVNGCAMCSYYHVKMALETGMESAEIHNMLSGEMKDVPDAELTAVLFALPNVKIQLMVSLMIIFFFSSGVISENFFFSCLCLAIKDVPLRFGFSTMFPLPVPAPGPAPFSGAL